MAAKKRGRPSDYMPEIAEDICNLLMLGESLRSICNRYHIATCKLAPFLDKFDKQGGFLDKLAQHGKAASIAAILSPISVVGHVASSAVSAHIAPKAQESLVKQANKELSIQPPWKEFFRTLPASEKEKISRVGIIGWFSGEDDN